MRLKVRFANNSKTYDLIAGSVLKDNFNETLDSGSIHLTNVYEEDRLHINPYDYVYIFDADSEYYKYFLVDSFIESYVNISQKIYDYQIDLMSETKILEKIQLPNRTITHSLNQGQTVIREQIEHFCELYIPKVKMKYGLTDSWAYGYLIDFNDIYNNQSEIFKKFHVKCPDFTWNNPTLRTVLTSLMSVQGCIPIVKDRKLSFLDLRANPSIFNIPEGRSFDFKKSLSSDSYVNTLSVMGENVLGEDNLVKNEILGFRDKDNVLLRHDDNLFLTTRLPIAKVEKLVMCANCTSFIGGCKTYPLSTITTSDALYGEFVSIGGNPYFMFKDENGNNYEIRNIKIKLYDNAVIQNGNPGKEIIEKGELIGTYTREVTHSNTAVVPVGNNSNFDYGIIEFEAGNPPLNNNFVYIIVNQLKYSYNILNLLSQGELQQQVKMYFVYRKDITPIVFEQGQRSMLSTECTTVPTLDNDFTEYRKYYYTTLGYQYGGTKIEGFSQHYGFVTWYGGYNTIFISELWDKLINYNTTGDSDIESVLSYFGVEQAFENVRFEGTVANVNGDYSEYSQMYFDITYQPFNSLNLEFSKSENIPLPIKQLDNQETGIPAFRSFSLREQEKIERLGQSVLQIHQSQVVDMNDINDINSEYEDYTIFSREIQLYESFADVNYVASKNYVLKNYFTSIETKYRAYEYVDFNNTTLRKENTKVFVLLSDHFVDGDDKIAFIHKDILDGTETGLTYASKVFLNLKDNIDGVSPYNYAFKAGMYSVSNIASLKNKKYKDDLSICYYDRNIVLSYKDFDSISPGIKIIQQGIVYYGNNQSLPGYMQQRITNIPAYTKRNFTYFTNLSLYHKIDDKNYVYDNEQEMQDYAELNLGLPEITLDLDQACREDETINSLVLVDNKDLYYISLSSSIAKLYHKSQDEVLSETVQFEYYTDNKYIDIGPLIHKLSCFNANEKQLYVVVNTTDELNDKIVESNYAGSLSSILTRSADGSYNINWGGTSVYEIRLLDHITDGKYYGYSMFRIKRALGNKLYVSLNDTKTTDVYSVDVETGLLNLDYECDFSVRTRKCIEKD